MQLRSFWAIWTIFTMCWISSAFGQAQWEQFRGAGGLGVAAAGQNLPVEFDRSKNVIWKCAVTKGHSSPCIWGNRIFLTGYAKRIFDTICIDRKSGKILWQKSIPVENIERVHQISSPAAPTPTTDGERVFVYFGSYGLLCYDFEGNLVWERKMPMPQNMYGTAASPILAGGKLIIMDDRAEDSWLLALDPETGDEIWKMDRAGFKAGWSTPVYRQDGEVEEVLVYSKWRVVAFDLKDGSERWTFPGLTDEPCITPVTGEGLVYLTSYNMRTNPEVIGLPKWSELLDEYDKDKDGELTLEETKPNKSILSRFDADGEGDHPLWGFFRFLDVDRSGKINEKEWGKMIAYIDSFEFENALLAIRPGEAGRQAKVVWKDPNGVPECPSPLYYQGRVYMVKDGGIASCLDARTGERKYQRLLGSGGPYYSSPVAADGKIYVGSARGMMTVFEAGDKLKVLARNNLKERIMATPAIVDGKIYVRTDKNLYAFGAKK